MLKQSSTAEIAIEQAQPESNAVLFYTGPFTHTLYREQFGVCPQGFNYIPATEELLGSGMKMDLRKRGARFATVKRSLSRKAVDFLASVGYKPAHAFDESLATNVDLIHSAQYLLKTEIPHVVDFEHVGAFGYFRRPMLMRKSFAAMVKRYAEQESCRFLLPWSHKAKRSLESCVDTSSFSDKVRVVPITVSEKTGRGLQRNAKSSTEPLKLLFVGTAFYMKGGLETIEAFCRLRKEVNAELTMVSFAPPEIVERYKDTPGLCLLEAKLGFDELDALYRAADVFVLPSHSDTFGYVFLEALSYGLPVVSIDHCSAPEIIEAGVSGELVKAETKFYDSETLLPRYNSAFGRGLIEDIKREAERESYQEAIAQAVRTVASDLPRYSEAALTAIKKGPFSPTRRRELLAEIYREALA